MAKLPSAGTPDRPLYFLHIPKAAGSSLTRLLRDAFAVGECAEGAYAHDYVALGPSAMSECSLLAGHWGTLPFHHDPRPMATVCTVRDPLERAWSHVRFLARRHTADLHAIDPSAADDPVGALTRDPLRWAAVDFQARWLAEPLHADTRREQPGPATFPHQFRQPSALSRGELRERSIAALNNFEVVGPSERLDDVVEAVSRLLGRWLPPPPRINSAPGIDELPPGLAEALAEATSLDRELHALSHRRLDAALEDLPPLPAFTSQPMEDLPVTYDMRDRFAGTGWHNRVEAEPPVGWHRWTGPEDISSVRLPWRLGGPATVRIHIVSAVDDEAVRGLRLELQGRPLDHWLEPAPTGCVAAASVRLDPDRPLDLTIRSGKTGRLTDAQGEPSPDVAGLAIGSMSVENALKDGRISSLPEALRTPL